MTHEIRADRTQSWLFPPLLDDLVPADAPVRFIDDFVNELDLGREGIKTEGAAGDGRPRYAPDLLLKVWLFGYLSRIRSSRKLEAACRDNTSLMWLTGMNRPDHNTLWRFWNENRGAFKSVFKRTVELAIKLEMVGFVLQAIDGTKVMSAASAYGVLDKKKLLKDLQKVESAIEELLKQTESLEREEQGLETRLPERLQQAKDRRQAIKEGLEKLRVAERDTLQPQDPQATRMKNERRVDMAYNAQVCTDEKAGIITGQTVSTHGSDNHLLNPVLDQVQEQAGKLARTTVLDGGYFSGEQLAKAEGQPTEALVNLRGTQADPRAAEDRFHSANFKHDPQKDCCVCPRGEVLTFLRVRTRNDVAEPYPVRVYRCRVFRSCPERKQCSGSRHGRKIEIAPFREAIQRQQEKQKSARARAALRKRLPVAERTNATIKHEDGFRRWSVKGLPKVAAQWALVCATRNLKIISRFWARSRPSPSRHPAGWPLQPIPT